MRSEAEYEIVVGLEVHAQLLTRTKLFCADTTEFGQLPNTQTSAISLGHPGTLPKLNREAIGLAVRLGLACQCEIVQHNYFARKNYFYPDLPKGYQISQHTTPICRNGFIEVATGNTRKQIRINRIHMEEDAGKSLHDDTGEDSFIDCNRAGMPLLEIVTEPDIRSAEEAFAYVTALRKMVRHLGVCDGDMEKGSLRCDVNISVRPSGDSRLGTRVEIKNLNSIRFIKKAIEVESRRLIGMHQKGIEILQQTRGWNENDFSTFAIRTKEDEDDYRYFPEPDLPPFTITDEAIEKIRSALPPLPHQIQARLENEYGLSTYDAQQLANDSELSNLFFAIAEENSAHKSVANWIIGPVKNYLADTESPSLPQPSALSGLIALVEKGTVSHGTALQKIFPALLQDRGLDLSKYIHDHDLQRQHADSDIDPFIEEALSRHAQKIPEYKKGKKGLISLFVGEVMKLSKGKADARAVTEKIIEKLNQR